MPSTATLTPYDLSEAEKVGRRLYRKQVLKKGTINYKGQKIKFDDAFLTDLAASFKAGAYDQVPFVLADTENRHNEDPERFRGEITGFEVTKDGLDALVAVNKQGAKVLEDNPKLGVSARIVQGLQKSDGRTFKRAIRHVLGTMDPRVTGLRPWQAVDLSEDDDTEVVVDLTAATYKEDGHMAKERKKGTKAVADSTVDIPDLDLSSMSDEEFLEFLDLGETTTTDEDSTVDDDTEGDNPDDRTTEEVEDDTDATTEDDGSGVTDIDPDAVDAGGDEEDGDTDLSSDVIDTEGRDEVTQMRIDLAEERYKSERKDLLRAGVPKHLVDLAAPLLSSPDALLLDLSNSDEPVDATKIVRDVLEGVKGMIDLRPEIGHQVDLSVEEESGEDALLKQWEQEYGTA